MTITSYTLPGSPAVVPVTSQGGNANGTLQPITDLCTETLTLLLAQYQDSPRLKSLICSFVERIQELETASLDVYNNVISIETAEGAQLDILGKIVGEARGDRNDAMYRNALRVRILINLSQGTIEDLVQIAALFEQIDLEVGSYVDVQEVQPARLEVRVVTTPTNPAEEIDKRLRLAKAAGVALTTLIHYGGPTASFVFNSPADYPEKSTTSGFSDNGIGAVTGGQLASAIVS